MMLSIVTVNKNNAEGLALTAKSINECGDTTKIEWIVIDGQSDDESIDVIKRHQHIITKWSSEPDKGIYDAMNKGLKLAKGKYVIFMNSGDCFINIEILVNQITSQTEDILYGDYSIFKKNQNIIVKQTSNLDFAYLLGKTINHQSYLIKTYLAQKYYFNCEYTIVADWIQLFEILKNEQPTIKYLGFPISIFDLNGISSSNTEKRIYQRNNYLKSCYSEWELESIRILSRLRQRVWYNYIIKSLNSSKRNSILVWLAKIIG